MQPPVDLRVACRFLVDLLHDPDSLEIERQRRASELFLQPVDPLIVAIDRSS
jgi:hypothetical protein